MKKMKMGYESPKIDVLDLHVETVLMGSPNEYYSGGAGSYGSGDTNNNGDY